MNYWPCETANLGECHLPAIKLDASLVGPGTKSAQAYYNAPGWYCAFTTNAWGWTAPGSDLPWGTFDGRERLDMSGHLGALRLFARQGFS